MNYSQTDSGVLDAYKRISQRMATRVRCKSCEWEWYRTILSPARCPHCGDFNFEEVQ